MIFTDPVLELAATSMEGTATVLFAFAVLHTFLASRISSLSHRFSDGSIGENLFHFLGEVEVVFGIWASILIFLWALRFGLDSGVAYLENLHFTEAAFVFVTMCMAATRPIMDFARRVLFFAAKLMPLNRQIARFISVLTIGPILGSLITEPAAMTVCALLARDCLLGQGASNRLKYVTIGLLFVNVSIGGTLTNFAAPPVVMVAKAWNWDTAFMFTQFGWKGLVAILINTAAGAFYVRRELSTIQTEVSAPARLSPPLWMTGIHIGFILFTVICSHHMTFFLPLFLLFLGWTAISKEYQDEIPIPQALLVGYFLGGLIALGPCNLGGSSRC